MATDVNLKHQQLQNAVRYLKTNHPYDALKHLRQLQATYPKDAVIQSYLGLALVLTKADTEKGMVLCADAAEASMHRPECIANFVRVCLKTGDRERAASAMNEGLALHSDHRELNQLAWQMGIRRKPFFSFLPRSNFMNRMTGRITWWLGVGRSNDPKRALPR